MRWVVSSQVVGGRAYATASVEESAAAAAALNEQAGAWRALAVSFAAAPLTLQGQRAGAALCPASASGTSGVHPDAGGGVHVALPYERLRERCEDHARVCRYVAGQAEHAAELLIRAYSLYSEAELTTTRLVDELVQFATAAFPGHVALAAGSLAVGGAIGGSLAEGGPNGMYALEATAWAHEGLMAGFAALVGGVGPVRGLRSTDEVNGAATGVARVTAPLYALVQGDTLTVRQVESRTDVVREAHSVADALENLRRLGEERLGKIDLDSGLEHGTIAIQEYRTADGSSSWLVTIPGTDGKPDSPFGWPQNVELMSDDGERRMHAASARMVVEAMERAGIGADEPVALVGHSQGGIVAAAIASDMADRFTIDHVVTAGSPVANHPIPDRTWVTSVEVGDELVAALDGAPNPATDTWLTVRGEVAAVGDGDVAPTVTQDGACAPGTGAGEARPFAWANVADSQGDKQISHWLKYHQAAYRHATDLGSPALDRHEEHFQGIIDGELVATTYWQGRMVDARTLAPGAPPGMTGVADAIGGGR